MISKEYFLLLVSFLTLVLKQLNISFLPEQIEGFAYIIVQLVGTILALLKIKTVDNTNWFGAIKK